MKCTFPYPCRMNDGCRWCPWNQTARRILRVLDVVLAVSILAFIFILWSNL